MCPRRNKSDNSNSKRQERETRQEEKKSREKKAHAKEDVDEKALSNQLRTFNLQLREIRGDGNCLFRSFADQFDGDQHRHRYYREQICDYMRTHREDFEPFVVDQPFGSFLSSMSKDGTYGGNECIVACSRLFDAKICIHQANQPVWTVCFSEPPKHEIHIFYHNHEHYSSVRKLGDHTSTSANIRQPMTTCDPSIINEKTKQTTKETNHGACAMDSTALYDEHDVDYILSQLPHPIDPQLIRDTLDDNHGDIDGAIASMLALNIPFTPEPTTTQPSTINEKTKQTTKEMNHGACAMDSTALYDEHDVDYIRSQLPHPVDPQLIRDTLDDNHGNIEGAIASMLALNIPSTPEPTTAQSSDQSIEKIMSITGVYDVELVQKSYATNNFDLDSTAESLLKLTTDDYEETSENEQTSSKTTTKNRPVPNRQVKVDKKKAKKQRAIEKHRAQIIAAAKKPPPKQAEGKPEPPANNEQEQIPPVNMEFIRI